MLAFLFVEINKQKKTICLIILFFVHFQLAVETGVSDAYPMTPWFSGIYMRPFTFQMDFSLSQVTYANNLSEFIVQLLLIVEDAHHLWIWN